MYVTQPPTWKKKKTAHQTHTEIKAKLKSHVAGKSVPAIATP
ncbi:TPA: hypothetical protein ACOFFI_004090 [Yersinia enterocolitica]